MWRDGDSTVSIGWSIVLLAHTHTHTYIAASHCSLSFDEYNCKRLAFSLTRLLFTFCQCYIAKAQVTVCKAVWIVARCIVMSAVVIYAESFLYRLHEARRHRQETEVSDLSKPLRGGDEGHRGSIPHRDVIIRPIPSPTIGHGIWYGDLHSTLSSINKYKNLSCIEPISYFHLHYLPPSPRNPALFLQQSSNLSKNLQSSFFH